MGGPRGCTQMADLAWHSQYASLNANLFGMCITELKGRILMCQAMMIFYVDM